MISRAGEFVDGKGKTMSRKNVTERDWWRGKKAWGCEGLRLISYYRMRFPDCFWAEKTHYRGDEFHCGRREDGQCPGSKERGGYTTSGESDVRI